MTNSLIGKPAPKVHAKAIVDNEIIDNFTLDPYLGQYVILFFYPLDFTFVCPTELHAFQDKQEEFKKRNANLVGCSIDSHFSHYAWMQIPKLKGGIEGIRYPLISDLNKTIARDYRVLKEDEGIAYRGQFLIDRQGIIRHQLINDLPLGRSTEEILRILDALIHYENYGEVCPANWKTGNKTMLPNQESMLSYFN